MQSRVLSSISMHIMSAIDTRIHVALIIYLYDQTQKYISPNVPQNPNQLPPIHSRMEISLLCNDILFLVEYRVHIAGSPTSTCQWSCGKYPSFFCQSAVHLDLSDLLEMQSCDIPLSILQEL